MRMNRYVKFGFSGSTVLHGSRGDPVSFYTTEGGGGCPFKGHSFNSQVCTRRQHCLGRNCR